MEKYELSSTEKARITKSLEKNMFILFMDRKMKRPYLAAHLDQDLLHHDNAPAHTSQTTQRLIYWGLSAFSIPHTARTWPP